MAGLTKCCDLVNLYSIFKPRPLTLLSNSYFLIGINDADTSLIPSEDCTNDADVGNIGVRKPPKLGVIIGVIGTAENE